MEATIFNQIKRYMMYIFEPLRSCTMYLLTCHGHSWTLVASNGLKFLKNRFFKVWEDFFLNVFFSTGSDIPWGPQKGILLGRFIRGQVDHHGGHNV